MVVPLFGWSAGDVAVSIKILYHIGEAFREAGGAKDQYAETASWLDSFAHDLEQIREYVADNPTAKYTDSIRQQIANIDPHYVHFEKYLQKHDPALSSTSSVGAVKRAFVKVRWAVKELKGQVDYLKTRISGPLMSMNLLLSLQHLHALERVSQSLASLPQGTTVDAIERTVLDIAAQLHQTELGLVDLQTSLNDQMTILMHLKASIQNDMSEEGQKILDAQTSMLSATLTAIDGSRSSAIKSLQNLGQRLDEVDQQMADTSTSLRDMLDDQKVAVQVCQMHLDHLQQTAQTIDQQPSQHALVESKGDWQELLRNAGICIGAFVGVSNMVTLRNIDAGLHASYQTRVDQQSSIYHNGPPTSAQSMLKRSHHDMSNVPMASASDSAVNEQGEPFYEIANSARALTAPGTSSTTTLSKAILNRRLFFSFFFSINDIEPDFAIQEPRFSTSPHPVWLPPNKKAAFEVIGGATEWYKWCNGEVAEVDTSSHDNIATYRSTTMFWCHDRQAFVQVPYDCTEKNVTDAVSDGVNLDWDALSFLNLMRGGLCLSLVGYRHESNELGAKGPYELVPNLLPQRYQPLRETGNAGFCGLAGELSIIMGLIAFSMSPETSVMDLGKSFTQVVWNLQWPRETLTGVGRVDRRGLVVHIGVDRSDPVSKERLKAWEQGDYGAMIWA